MNHARSIAVVFVLALGALAACSSSAPQTGRASPVTPPQTVVRSATTSPTPSAPTTSSYSMADLPDNGRNFAACETGHCRVTVRPGDRVPVPISLGGTTLVIESIGPDSVTMQEEGTGGGNTTITFQDAASGSGMISGQKFSLAFVEIGNGQAVMQVDV